MVNPEKQSTIITNSIPMGNNIPKGTSTPMIMTIIMTMRKALGERQRKIIPINIINLQVLARYW